MSEPTLRRHDPAVYKHNTSFMIAAAYSIIPTAFAIPMHLSASSVTPARDIALYATVFYVLPGLTLVLRSPYPVWLGTVLSLGITDSHIAQFMSMCTWYGGLRYLQIHNCTHLEQDNKYGVIIAAMAMVEDIQAVRPAPPHKGLIRRVVESGVELAVNGGLAAIGFLGPRHISLHHVAPAAAMVGVSATFLQSVARYVLVAFGFNFTLQALGGFYRLLFSPFPLQMETCQHYPFLSGSLREFWSRRWNVCIGRLLKDVVYDSFADKMTHAVGVVSTFIVSGLMHCGMFYAGGSSVKEVLGVFAYFMLQPIGLWIEQQLPATKKHDGKKCNYSRYPPSQLRRLFFWAFTLSTAPLFVLPIVSGNALY